MGEKYLEISKIIQKVLMLKTYDDRLLDRGYDQWRRLSLERYEPWNMHLVMHFGFKVIPMLKNVHELADGNRAMYIEGLGLLPQSDKERRNIQRYRYAFVDIENSVRRGQIRVAGCRNGIGDRIEIPLSQRSALRIQHPRLCFYRWEQAVVKLPRTTTIGYAEDLAISRSAIESALGGRPVNKKSPNVWTDLLFNDTDINRNLSPEQKPDMAEAKPRQGAKVKAALEALDALYPNYRDSPKIREKVTAIMAVINEWLAKENHPITRGIRRGGDYVSWDTVNRALDIKWPETM